MASEQLSLLLGEAKTNSRRTNAVLGLAKAGHAGGSGAPLLLKALVRQGLDEDAYVAAAALAMALEEIACTRARSGGSLRRLPGHEATDDGSEAREAA